MPNDESAHVINKSGFDALDSLWTTLDQMEASVADHTDAGHSFVEEPIERILNQIRAFEPSVSIIGQVKAGKSTLLNALIGQPGLLPSDVNPWTSVITALHLNARHRPMNTAALFRFFDADEWDRLVETGGRLGEIAARAGFASEASEVRSQVTEMRETTEARLGAEFDQLLGTSRAYPTLDKDTLDRYICYGDPDDLAEGAPEGVYADLTKSADLYLDRPDLPRGLCLRDTPGVNDTFMMREQITLNAISDSRICVVVLSAHQALTTMDLALLRIIGSIEAREIVIFVNRIDELQDPVTEADRIEGAIRKTLKRLGLFDGIEILFGSGYWANCALSDQVETMLPASRAALDVVIQARGPEAVSDLRDAAMDASGVPALYAALACRVVEGPGQALLADIQSELDNIAEMSETVRSIAHRPGGGTVRPDITREKLADVLSQAHSNAIAGFDEAVMDLRNQLRDRLLRAQETFVQSAMVALQSHIDMYGEFNAWKHDPTSLRMAMKTAFSSATARLRRESETALDVIMDDTQHILQSDLGVFRDNSSVTFPSQPQHKAPTVLARTLSLDLEGPWWRRFWKFGGRRSAEKRYRAMIEAETAPLIDDLITGFFDPAVDRSRDVLQDFARDQAGFAQAILDCAQSPAQPDDDLETRLSA